MVEHVTFNPLVVGSTPTIPTKGAILALLLAFSGCASHQIVTPEKCKNEIVAEELAEYSRLCDTLKFARDLVRKREWKDQIEKSLRKCEYVFGNKYSPSVLRSNSNLAERKN